jgi:hypothetical protein
VTDPLSGPARSAADEALLEQLAEALRPPPLTPPAASVAALRREVELKWNASFRARLMAKLLAWARRLQRTGAAVAVLGGVAVGGTGMALAAGGSTERPAYNMPHPAYQPYPAEDLAIPVPPAGHHLRYDHDPGAGLPSGQLLLQAPSPALSTALSPHRSEPVTTDAVSAVFSTALLGRGGPGLGGAARRPPSPPTGYLNRAVAGGGFSPAATNLSLTYRIYSGGGLATRPGPNSLRPSGTTPNAGSPPARPGRWWTASGWPEMSGASPAARNAPTTTTTSWPRSSGAVSSRNGAYRSTAHYRYRGLRTGP